jgi:hypothetical protein
LTRKAGFTKMPDSGGMALSQDPVIGRPSDAIANERPALHAVVDAGNMLSGIKDPTRKISSRRFGAFLNFIAPLTRERCNIFLTLPSG